MAIQIQGTNGVVADVGGTGFRSIKVQQMPVEVGSLGAYRKSLLSGTMAAGLAANSEIFQFRWTDATRICLVRKILLNGLAGSATAFAAGFSKVDLVVARSWTVDGAGGTSGTLTGNNSKMRTSFGTTLLGSIRIASTAALTIGTKTLDTDPVGLCSFSIGTTANVTYVQNWDLLGEDVGPEHPLVLTQNEGFILRATVPATGTWQFGVTVIWSEVASY